RLFPHRVTASSPLPPSPLFPPRLSSPPAVSLCFLQLIRMKIIHGTHRRSWKKLHCRHLNGFCVVSFKSLTERTIALFGGIVPGSCTRIAKDHRRMNCLKGTRQSVVIKSSMTPGVVDDVEGGNALCVPPVPALFFCRTPEAASESKLCEPIISRVLG